MKADIRTVHEEQARGPVPFLFNPEWRDRWPGVVQGTTLPGEGRGWDFGLFGAAPAGEVTDRWEALSRAAECPGVVHARQPHGSAVRLHPHPLEGLKLAPPADAHLTRARRLLLAVSVADCVPVFILAPGLPAVAMVHAGWRGTVEGILEGAVTAFRDRMGVGPRELSVHLGPSICGRCYEVGPEVHRALGEPEPHRPAPVDLPANLARRALKAGVPEGEVTRSGHCTRCGEVDLFSHRGGDGARQVAFMGLP